MTDVRVTQGAVEVLYDPPRPNVKVTQGGVEVLYAPPRPSVKITTAAVEVMYVLSSVGLIVGTGGDGVNRGEGVSPFAGVSIGNGVGG